jgi:hypothetical protein
MFALEDRPSPAVPNERWRAGTSRSIRWKHARPPRQRGDCLELFGDRCGWTRESRIVRVGRRCSTIVVGVLWTDAHYLSSRQFRLGATRMTKCGSVADRRVDDIEGATRSEEGFNPAASLRGSVQPTGGADRGDRCDLHLSRAGVVPRRELPASRGNTRSQPTRRPSSASVKMKIVPRWACLHATSCGGSGAS